MKCKHSDLGEYNSKGDEDFICTLHHFEEGIMRCICDNKCPSYEPDREAYIEDMCDQILDLFKEYPHEMVNQEYVREYKKTQTHHIELDSCGREIWVKNDD